jgi:hypothetical protein
MKSPKCDLPGSPLAGSGGRNPTKSGAGEGGQRWASWLITEPTLVDISIVQLVYKSTTTPKQFQNQWGFPSQCCIVPHAPTQHRTSQWVDLRLAPWTDKQNTVERTDATVVQP